MATTYNPRIVTNGLALYLDAANPQSYSGSGTTWTDLSRNGNNGTLTNGPTFNSNNRGSILFDGTNDQVIIPSTSAKNTFNGKTALTVSIWAYLKSYHPTDGTTMISWPISNTAATSPYTVFFVSVSKLGVLVASVGNGTARTVFTSSFNVGLYSWNNFGLIWDGANLYAFLNGNISTTSAAAVYTINYTGTADLFVGSYNSNFNGYWHDGNISQVAIYDRNLTSAEIKQNYYALMPRFPSSNIVTDGLVLHLDAGNRQSYPSSGTTWTDLSGNGNNGTLTNGPTFSSANGGSIVFDGVNDYVQCTGSYTSTEFTFIAWIKRNGNQAAWAGILYSRGTNVTGIQYRNNTNQLVYNWNGSSSAWNWVSNLLVPDQTWCMVAVSVYSSRAVAYLCQASGITSATNNISHTSTTLNDIKISYDDAETTRVANQSVAVASIYNRALSAAEIAQNFNAIRERFGV